MKPLIHILYGKVETLLWFVIAKFVKLKYFTEKKNEEKCALSAAELSVQKLIRMLSRGLEILILE